MRRSKQSDKISLIDKNTYERVHKKDSAMPSTTKKIHNSKYKKHHAGPVNLLDFLVVKQKRMPKAQRRLRLVINRPYLIGYRKRGKTRESGTKKKTRLKKSILRYRREKRSGETECLTECFQNLKLDDQATPPQVHSRRFRAYCENCTTPRLAELTEQLLRDLYRFQKRAFVENPLKAKRRLVVGFREIRNYLRINKIKLVIIAPDCEQASGEAGLDETIADIKHQCQQQGIPYLFSLRRRQLSYTLYKKVPISAVGILNYDGAQTTFAQMKQALEDAKNDYEILLKKEFDKVNL